MANFTRCPRLCRIQLHALVIWTNNCHCILNAARFARIGKNKDWLGTDK
ncbi:hypothetical protein GPUN_2668 [Glaciecola punicea ACAM 611]|uniref:Uncharacterized protein n=1 Tax=Glaciecola punicea ACAM 611 TaxID=1121923 RepID=H5TEQ5_9ALTE|nr:hypothetical protein GPUN_2668 [Glaciecola punicea ACAM 611]